MDYDESPCIDDPVLAAAMVSLDYKLLNVYEEKDEPTIYIFGSVNAPGAWVEIQRAYREGTLKVNARQFARYLKDIEDGTYLKKWAFGKTDVVNG